MIRGGTNSNSERSSSCGEISRGSQWRSSIRSPETTSRSWISAGLGVFVRRKAVRKPRREPFRNDGRRREARIRHRAPDGARADGSIVSTTSSSFNEVPVFAGLGDSSRRRDADTPRDLVICERTTPDSQKEKREPQGHHGKTTRRSHSRARRTSAVRSREALSLPRLHVSLRRPPQSRALVRKGEQDKADGEKNRRPAPSPRV